MTVNTKDIAAGALFVGLGLLIGGYSLLTLDMGTALRMGPGFFPLMLAGVLTVIGGITALSAVGTAPSSIGGIPWRGLVLVLAAPIVFGATIRGLGFVPATASTIILAVLASRRMTPTAAMLITLALTGFCTLVFVIGLRVPVRLFGPWLGQ